MNAEMPPYEHLARAATEVISLALFVGGACAIVAGIIIGWVGGSTWK